VPLKNAISFFKVYFCYNNFIGAHPEDGVSDLTLISNIDERGINLTLSTRYKRDEIYVIKQSQLKKSKLLLCFYLLCRPVLAPF